MEKNNNNNKITSAKKYTITRISLKLAYDKLVLICKDDLGNFAYDSFKLGGKRHAVLSALLNVDIDRPEDLINKSFISTVRIEITAKGKYNRLGLFSAIESKKGVN